MKELLIDEYTVHRKLPANIEQKDHRLFERELSKTFSRAYLYTLKNAYVLDDLVLHHFRFYIKQTLSYQMHWREQLKRLKFLFKKSTYYPKAIWILDDWSGGYFHWLMDALPRLIACNDRIDGHLVLLPESYRHLQYIRDTLDLLGLGYTYYREKCKIGELLLPDHVTPSGNYNYSLFQSIKEKLLKNISPATPARKIYVSRSRTAFRKMTNEEEIISILEKFGFEIHHFENYSLKDQMQLMQETQYLVGMHGNALTNIYFMQEGTRVFELRFENDRINNCFYSLATANHIDYYYQICPGTSMDSHIADMTVDKHQFEAILHKLLGE